MADLSDTDYFQRVGQSILDGVIASMRCKDISVPDRSFVGFSRPPQDCCPELVAWITNIRTWDGNFPEGLREGRLLCFNSYAFDVTIRIGRCYVDSASDGSGIDHGTLSDWASELYKDAGAIYIGFIQQWRAGEVSELSSCEPLAVGNMTSYNEGGCAGWEFTITTGIL